VTGEVDMQITESNATAGFETARDEYLATMGHVPPDAVRYLKPGDDYSLGGIAVHVNFVLEHYANVLEAMVAEGFGECRPQDPDGLHERADARAKASLPSDEVSSELARTERLHRRVGEIVAGIADVERKAPVWYPGGAEAFPTSAADVLGWLTDHYREHVPQIEALTAEAEGRQDSAAMAVVTAFCEAFDRRDVDAVMALMTDDCVFESTMPPPDGERLVGQAAVRGYWEQFFGTTEAPPFVNEEMFAAGDRVVSRWRFAWGSGAGGGHVRGIDLYRVRGGKVAEKLAYVKG
jgi:ketosteroid isomerase-like protein